MNNYEPDNAACRGKPTSWWYPVSFNRQEVALAKYICGKCPVQVECLQYAIDNREHDGVWGGLTPMERELIRPRGSPLRHGRSMLMRSGCKCDECCAYRSEQGRRAREYQRAKRKGVA